MRNGRGAGGGEEGRGPRTEKRGSSGLEAWRGAKVDKIDKIHKHVFNLQRDNIYVMHWNGNTKQGCENEK